MRKLAVAAIAATAIAAAPARSPSENHYAVVHTSISPAHGGSTRAPLPVTERFGFTVAAADPTERAIAIQTFSIADEGIVASPADFPSCSLTQLANRFGVSPSCRPAKIGTGIVKTLAGKTADMALGAGTPCNLRLSFYNLGRRVGVRVDGDPPPPRSPDSDIIGCPISMHTGFPATLGHIRIDGIPTTELRVSVPLHLLVPFAGFAVSVHMLEGSFLRRRASVGVGRTRRQVGFFSSIGCGNGSRTARVTAIDVPGHTAVPGVATTQIPC